MRPGEVQAVKLFLLHCGFHVKLTHISILTCYLLKASYIFIFLTQVSHVAASERPAVGC